MLGRHGVEVSSNPRVSHERNAIWALSHLLFIQQEWEEKATEAHMTVLRDVPEDIKRLWFPGMEWV